MGKKEERRNVDACTPGFSTYPGDMVVKLPVYSGCSALSVGRIGLRGRVLSVCPGPFAGRLGLGGLRSNMSVVSVGVFSLAKRLIGC